MGLNYCMMSRFARNSVESSSGKTRQSLSIETLKERAKCREKAAKLMKIKRGHRERKRLSQHGQSIFSDTGSHFSSVYSSCLSSQRHSLACGDLSNHREKPRARFGLDFEAIKQFNSTRSPQDYLGSSPRFDRMSVTHQIAPKTERFEPQSKFEDIRKVRDRFQNSMEKKSRPTLCNIVAKIDRPSSIVDLDKHDRLKSITSEFERRRFKHQETDSQIYSDEKIPPSEQKFSYFDDLQKRI